MGQEYLIDSNAVIDFFNKSLPEGGKNLLMSLNPIISIVTFIEILGNKGMTDEERVNLYKFTEAATIYEVDHNVALKTIELRLNYKIKLPDAFVSVPGLYLIHGNNIFWIIIGDVSEVSKFTLNYIIVA